MTGSVIIRVGTTVIDQRIHHDDQPIAWSDADARAGCRLDRRKSWAFIEGDLCESAQWSEACSGCSYGFEERGGGCRECGYQGHVRTGMWLPADLPTPVSEGEGDIDSHYLAQDLGD